MRRWILIILIGVVGFDSAQNNNGKKSEKQSGGKKITETLSLSAEKLSSSTGVYTLENGGKSFLARLWLAQNAQKTIDIQLFSFAKDACGLIAADFMVYAADRGIKVRLLIDDAASRMYSHEVRLFDSHENIEVRVYNPGLMLGKPHHRARMFARNSLRLQSRMHNKLIIIDEQIGITGGRNIADEYADYHKKHNFRDRDVLFTGKIVKEMKESFDKFWNSDSFTVPYSELSGKKVERLSRDTARFTDLHKQAAGSSDFLKETREKINLFPLEIDSAMKRGEFMWVKNAKYISDVAGKNTEFLKSSRTLLSDSMIAIMHKTKYHLIIESPYVILTDTMKKFLKYLIDRGVRVKIMTNSMASIDSHKAFSAYKKGRKEILKMGIELYEWKPDAKLRYKYMLPDKQAPKNYKADYGYHSKTVIIDSAVALIGSYNFDPRSHFYNTECMSVIHSEKVAEHLLKIAAEEFSEDNSWKVTLDSNPDKHAGVGKRLSTFFNSVIPRRML